MQADDKPDTKTEEKTWQVCHIFNEAVEFARHSMAMQGLRLRCRAGPQWQAQHLGCQGQGLAGSRHEGTGGDSVRERGVSLHKMHQSPTRPSLGTLGFHLRHGHVGKPREVAGLVERGTDARSDTMTSLKGHTSE